MKSNRPSPAQIRGAVGILNWPYTALAKASGVAVDTISKLCLEKHKGQDETLSSIGLALERAGIEFLDGDGLRRRNNDTLLFIGVDRIDAFYEVMYQHLSHFGGPVCLSVADERLLSKYRTDPNLHRNRMKALVDTGKIPSFRILAKQGNFTSTYATYRMQPRSSAQQVSFYAFGDCIAFITFAPEPKVRMMQDAALANAYREEFELLWEHADKPPEQSCD